MGTGLQRQNGLWPKPEQDRAVPGRTRPYGVVIEYERFMEIAGEMGSSTAALRRLARPCCPRAWALEGDHNAVAAAGSAGL